MAAIGLLEEADATTCAGEETVDPLAGEVTVMPANAGTAKSMSAQKKVAKRLRYDILRFSPV